MADFILRPPSLTAGNFKAVWPEDPKFLTLKVLNLLKYQKTSYNIRLGFALSNRPHFNSTYLLRLPFSSGKAVSSKLYNLYHSKTVSKKRNFEYKVFL